MAKMQQQRNSRKGKGRKAPRGGKGAFGSTGPSCKLSPPGRLPYRFERVIAPTTLVPPAVDSGRSFTYTLGSLPGAAEFTALFDLYRFTAFEITFCLNAVAPTEYYPVLHMLADYDSFTTPATFDVVLQRPHKRVTLTPASPSYTFKLRPRVLAVVQTSAGSSASALAASSQWMDCNDSTIIYGGLIGWIENFNAVSGTIINVTTRVLLDLAMVR